MHQDRPHFWANCGQNDTQIIERLLEQPGRVPVSWIEVSIINDLSFSSLELPYLEPLQLLGFHIISHWSPFKEVGPYSLNFQIIAPVITSDIEIRPRTDKTNATTPTAVTWFRLRVDEIITSEWSRKYAKFNMTDMNTIAICRTRWSNRDWWVPGSGC
jgi:hypothetical protein